MRESTHDEHWWGGMVKKGFLDGRGQGMMKKGFGPSRGGMVKKGFGPSTRPRADMVKKEFGPSMGRAW